MTHAGTPPVTEDRIYSALGQIVDPELGINIVDLGLIYAVQVREGDVAIRMTLTTRGCPLHTVLAQAAERAIRHVAGVRSAQVEMVWEPPWTPDRISPEGRRALASQ
jgi:metal-sulfur cluster biosynthetic enzyme